MYFKVTGVLLLLAGAYFAIAALIGVEQQHNEALSVQVEPLIAIFLVLLVRVLQAEKHHREWLKHAATHQPREKLEHGKVDEQLFQTSL